MDLVQLGKNISAIRRARHLTQEDVAFELNITNVSYSRIERGITDISFSRLLQIANYFKTPIECLVRDEKDVSNEKIDTILTELLAMKEDICEIKDSIINV
ncbi:MAG: helix-turn-helix domain-containing protein [Bacteroidales bacterium]|nr:helix-turn-helix domain-containing protein [Bacteroidales bacterium]